MQKVNLHLLLRKIMNNKKIKGGGLLLNKNELQRELTEIKSEIKKE